MTLPNDLQENSSAVQKRYMKKRICDISNEMIYDENMKTLLSKMRGHVSDVLKHRIQALNDFKRMNSERDSLALLVALQNQAFNYHSQKEQWQALEKAVMRLYLISQGKTESCQVYMDHHENSMQVITHIGGKLLAYTSLVDSHLKAKWRDHKTATAYEIEKSGFGIYLWLWLSLFWQNYKRSQKPKYPRDEILATKNSPSNLHRYSQMEGVAFVTKVKQT